MLFLICIILSIADLGNESKPWKRSPTLICIDKCVLDETFLIKQELCKKQRIVMRQVTKERGRMPKTVTRYVTLY